jgi:hypothetical protein
LIRAFSESGQTTKSTRLSYGIKKEIKTPEKIIFEETMIESDGSEDEFAGLG